MDCKAGLPWAGQGPSPRGWPKDFAFKPAAISNHDVPLNRISPRVGKGSLVFKKWNISGRFQIWAVKTTMQSAMGDSPVSILIGTRATLRSTSCLDAPGSISKQHRQLILASLMIFMADSKESHPE